MSCRPTTSGLRGFWSQRRWSMRSMRSISSSLSSGARRSPNRERFAVHSRLKGGGGDALSYKSAPRALMIAAAPSQIAAQAVSLHQRVRVRRRVFLQDSAGGVAALQLAVVHIHPVDDLGFCKRDGLTEGDIGHGPGSVVELSREMPVLFFEWHDPEVLHVFVVAHSDLDGEALRFGRW